jgi:hypothetical protein
MTEERLSSGRMRFMTVQAGQELSNLSIITSIQVLVGL